MFGLRKMTWVLILWCGGIVVWVVVAGAQVHQEVQSCINQGILSAQTCQRAVDAGTGLGVLGILFVGFIGFVFFSLIWLMSRPAGPQAPAPPFKNAATR